mgnify:CR=1 FL=1
MYCSTCGCGTSYSMVKPKFCSSCGGTFSALEKTPAKRVFKAIPKNPIATVQQEVEEEFEMPDMNKLDVDINVSRAFNVMSFKEIAGTIPNDHDDGFIREADSSYSAESVVEDFMRDAGSSSRTNEQTRKT